jgi:hypothetical protein
MTLIHVWRSANSARVAPSAATIAPNTMSFQYGSPSP